MNLTGQLPFQKGKKPARMKEKSRPASKQERDHWERIRALGCIVGPVGCQGRITIHHCGTRRGGRKDHKKVIALCWEHHLGDEGIDGKVLSTAKWEARYGTEDQLLERTQQELRR